MAAAEHALRSHGLKARLLLIAILAGLTISATLFVLEYLDYRQTRAAVGDQGERSLLTAEIQRLDVAASDLAAATAPALENALRARDEETVSRIATALLENHATIAVRVLRPDGTQLFETRRSNAWASSLAAEEQRTVRRDLGDVQTLGTLELTVARPGLRSSAAALRTQLQTRRAARLRAQGLDHRRRRRADHRRCWRSLPGCSRSGWSGRSSS